MGDSVCEWCFSRNVDDYLSRVAMTPQPTIARRSLMEQRYDNWKGYQYSIDAYAALVKHQYFQLLIDLSTVIAYFRYSGLNRDCKV